MSGPTRSPPFQAPPHHGAVKHLLKLGPSRLTSSRRSLSQYSSSSIGLKVWSFLWKWKKKPQQQRTKTKVRRVWSHSNRVKWLLTLTGLLGLFLFVNCFMLSRLQDDGVNLIAGLSDNSSAASISVSVQEKFVKFGSLQAKLRKFGKQKRPVKGNYERLLSLAAHTLAEGQNKREPKDLWKEPVVPASAWKPCADQHNWEPSGKQWIHFGYCKWRDESTASSCLQFCRCCTTTQFNFGYSQVYVHQFSDIFQEAHFINYLTPDIRIVKELPKELQSLDLEAIGSVVTYVDIGKEAKPSFYLKNILPILLKNKVVHFLGYGNCLEFDLIPFELQRLRCRCNFHALQFVPRIQETGVLLLQRLRLHVGLIGQLDRYLVGPLPDANLKENGSHAKKASKYLALHLRFEIDMVAHSLCEFGGGEEEKQELEAYREIHFPALTLLKKTRKLPSPSELKFAALTNLYPNLVTKENLLSPKELEPFVNYSSQLAALDFIGCTAADAFAMTDSGSQLSSLVSGYRIYYGEGRMPTIRPNNRRLASIFLKNSTIEWRVFEQRMRKAVRQTKHVQTRPKARSVYRYPRCKECMCRTD
ncbi:O-fucosyltransferase [Quillaja saponaria]|uniref:O-fucosyltransferase family protein n=1 Tax=Quillaja saponaria TaxID=32244 RepID=A0AAD7PTJ6_QUISA|nr:O-fucosyltransferase [Quillaja saponaria]